MLNFRKLRQDFPSSILREGKELYDKSSVINAKILLFDTKHLRISSRIKGAFDNVYESEIEINRSESMAVDSNCDCTYTYDCQHIAALLYYLEENLNEIVVKYSKQTDLTHHDEEVKQGLLETFVEAEAKEDKRKDLKFQKEILREYQGAALQLGGSPFFLPPVALEEDKAELAIIFSHQTQEGVTNSELQLAIRLPSRSKPLLIPNVKAFLDAVRYREPLSISGKRYFFTQATFEPIARELLNLVISYARFHGSTEEKYLRVASLEKEALGTILAKAYDLALGIDHKGASQDATPMPCLYYGNLEEPLCLSSYPAQIKFILEYLEAPGPTILLKPSVRLDEESVDLDQALLFESTRPGLIHKNTYYRFQPKVRRLHLKSLPALREITIPEPLFGTFIENGLPVLRQYAEVANLGIIDRFVTLPFVETLRGRCEINYLNGELEAKLFFVYGKNEIPASLNHLSYDNVSRFIATEGILARNLVEERRLIEEIFEDFLYDEKEGIFRVKSEKKIVEFMTEVIPKNQHRIDFACPENLSEQFIYDESSFELALSESERIDTYKVELKVDGFLRGVSLDLLWDCLASKKRFLELHSPMNSRGRPKSLARILVLDLEKISPLVQIFDEIGLSKLENYIEEKPLWSLTSIQADLFKTLPIKFSMSKKLKEIQKQLLGDGEFAAQKVPEEIQATLRNYQMEGIHWLERLRKMHLGGILADDMGLGKTLQAIIAITQSRSENTNMPSLIVCPTSLVYNWKEEFHKFNPKMQVLVIDSIPDRRKKALKAIEEYDIAITSYNLLQKDIEIYKGIHFNYVVLDEAQHIKNRGTRNAKSVKMIQAAHRLILTGTPIENSLEELWSLFDFLMPGLLSSYDRFVEKYIRKLAPTIPSDGNALETLKKKVSPFILRRMKEDVLNDLPPVSEILYHCHLTERQKELYSSYAASAKEELSRLVKKEGFDKIQIHVLATLTRLKQICCHPAIFAKEGAEAGDSAKYDMLMELLPSLIEGRHKTVIFSQYTKMLTIMREDLKQLGITFAYLDGSSKNRLEIVKQFNDDPKILVFLVSLKAGGSGLNLTSADTVIHYDMWWNPAVENQATDRVHRLGQKRSVSSYKLITLNTIEEKILNLQNRKKGIVKKVISSDDEAISKLTWEEVLELLQT